MKAGAVVLVAKVSLVNTAFPFPFGLPLFLPVGAVLCAVPVACFFFDTADAGGLPGAFLAAELRVLAMIEFPTMKELEFKICRVKNGSHILPV